MNKSDKKWKAAFKVLAFFILYLSNYLLTSI